MKYLLAALFFRTLFLGV